MVSSNLPEANRAVHPGEPAFHLIKLSVSPNETQTACGSMVRFLSFSQTCCTSYNMFVKK